MEHDTNTDNMVTVREAATGLGVTLSTVHAKLYSNRIPGAKQVLNRWLIPADWLKKELERREAKATPNGGNGR
jgi:excisionase family DNA binding protein